MNHVVKVAHLPPSWIFSEGMSFRTLCSIELLYMGFTHVVLIWCMPRIKVFEAAYYRDGADAYEMIKLFADDQLPLTAPCT